MEHHTSNKIIRTALTIVSILIVVVSTALYLQGKQINKLKEELEVNNPAEKSRTEIKADNSSSVKSLSQDDEEKYEMKIKKLETQVAEMQEWQDYLKKSIKENEEKADSAASNQSKQASQVNRDFFTRRYYSITYNDFFEENNILPELREKFFDLLIEKNNAMKERGSIFDLISAKEKVDKGVIEELMQKTEKITAEYDEKIAELLSEDGLAAYKEYEKTSMARSFLRDFRKMLGDDKLEKEKELKLISLMYDYRKSWEEERKLNVPSYELGEQQDKETMKEISKLSVEWSAKLYDKYLSLAEGILSESQLEKYEGFVNMRKAHLKMGNYYDE